MSKKDELSKMGALPLGVPPLLVPNRIAMQAMRDRQLRKPSESEPVPIRKVEDRTLNGMAPGMTIFKLIKSRPIKLLIRNHLSPGDILMLTAAIRDLHKAYPNLFSTDVETSADQLFENNPHITKLDRRDPELFVLQAEYPLINACNEGPWHFVETFHSGFETKLGIQVKPTKMRGDVHISDLEKSWYSQIHDIVGRDIPFWIIDAGCKFDYTCKQWEISRYQEVVNRLPEVPFVQIGTTERMEEVDDGKGGKQWELKDKGHKHPTLQGPNVISLLNKTDLRQLMRLMYHAAGVITPVSFPMHLCAAVEMKSVYKRKTRPCIVIAGGREPNQWEAYANHQYLHTCGQLSCCDNGGCWRSRIRKLNDGEVHDADDKICLFPVTGASGQLIPTCMDMITADQVVDHVRHYLKEWNYYLDWRKEEQA